MPFADPASLLLTPDHYVFRMLYSQGIRLEDFGVARIDGGATERDSRKIWRLFAQALLPVPRHADAHVVRLGAVQRVRCADIPLTPENADATYDRIAERLQKPEFRPRALFERFNIEALATTESPLDDLMHHVTIRKSGWHGRVITAYRPDNVVDPDAVGFPRQPEEVQRAHRRGRVLVARLPRRASQAPRVFRGRWARRPPITAIPTARTADLCPADAEALFMRIVKGAATRATRTCSAARCSPKWRA